MSSTRMSPKKTATAETDAEAETTSERTKQKSQQAKLRILDKEVTIGCRPGEEEDLKQAAAYIDRSMRDLKSRNTTSSIEKIAIVTAINTADALLKSRARQGDDPEVLKRLATLNSRLASALDEPEVSSLLEGTAESVAKAADQSATSATDPSA